jgi:hypothetical protein
MFAQSLEQSRYLMSALARQIATDIVMLKSADVEFTLDDGSEKIKVIAIEKIELTIAADNRTALSDDFVKLSMDAFDVYFIGQFMSFAVVINLYEAVVEQLKTNTFSIQLRRQLAMAVMAELQPEWDPCGHSQIAQSQLRRDEVEVTMQTPAGDRLEIGFVCFLVMPRLITSTRFHRREYIRQSWTRTSLFDNPLNTVFFAEFLFAEKFDFQTIFLCPAVAAKLFGNRKSNLSRSKEGGERECDRANREDVE